jgi:D-alanyl-D-alanine carboxypeptidase/D-alanyl-D-alanine-endopeptidase (penicillin-binding protein 4)
VLAPAVDSRPGGGGPPAVGTPGTAALSRRIAAVLAGPDLGEAPGAFVLDVSSDEVLFERDARTARTPASILKIVVGAAALLTLGPERRIETRVVTGTKPFEVVLVGGGDSTLTGARPRARSYPLGGSLAQLAAATAASLRGRGNRPVTVSIDDSLFVGPSMSPEWEPDYVRTGVVAPVQALMVNQGRIRNGGNLRSRDPALAAGRRFVQLLAREGIEVQGALARTAAAPGAKVLASVRSAPLATLVETMLATSDNDLAESLARLAARGVGSEASFEGFSSALPTVLMRVGLSAASLRLLDGSGLARGSKMSAQLVVQLLALAARDARLRPILTGLPVAGFSGTLADRFSSGPTASGAGLVRAKTGTLTGVAGLAGIAATASGRLVAFAVLSDRLAPAEALPARRRLDRLAASLSAAA